MEGQLSLFNHRSVMLSVIASKTPLCISLFLVRIALVGVVICPWRPKICLDSSFFFQRDVC
jgi:hypothetical protein